jgi:hypothetical protein
MSIEQYLPSKEFKKRVMKIGFLLLIVAVVRFGAYPLIQNIFSKNKIPENITVKQFVDIDTDGDKLPDWEESIWGTDPKKADSDGDGVSDFDFVSSKKQGLLPAEQNETAVLSSEIMQTLFALMGKGAVTGEAIANLGSAAGESIIKPELTNKYTINDFAVTGIGTVDIKNYYLNFQKSLNTFNKSKAPDEFQILAISISAESPDQLIDLDQTINKYKVFEGNLVKVKVPSDVAQTHLAFVNSVASIISSLEKSKQLYSNSVIGINGIIELRLAHSNLDAQVKLLHSYFLRNGLIQ